MIKFIRIFLVLLCLHTASFAQYNADKTLLINEVFQQAPLARVLKQIQNKYDIKVGYDDQAVKNIIINVVLRNATVEECFKKILQNTSLEYLRVGENVIITQKTSHSANPTRLNFTVKGVVVDSETGEPLPYVLVGIVGTRLATNSNKDGHFTLLDIPNDTLALEVRHLGYISQVIALNGIADPTYITIKIKDEVKVLENFVVTADYKQALQVEQEPSKIAFNPKFVRSLPSLGEQDVFRTLQLLPGVKSTDESSSGLSIRGMHPSQNLVLFDGITLYQLDHLFGAFSVLNSDVIKDVQVSKGMFDAKYGGRVSGVIDIISKNGNTTKPTFNVGANLISLRATAEIPLSKKISFIIAGRRSNTDVVQTPLFTKLYDIGSKTNDLVRLFANYPISSAAKSSYFFYDVNAKITYKPTSKDIISAAVYNSEDHLVVQDTSASALLGNIPGIIFSHDESTTWGNVGESARWGRQWNDTFYSNVRIANSMFFRTYDFKISINDDTIQYALKNNIHDLNFAIDNEWQLNDRVSLDFGLSSLSQTTRDVLHQKQNSVDDTTEFASNNNVNTLLISLYGTIHAKLTHRLNITLGSRISHYQLTKNIYLEPRTTLCFDLSTYISLKAAYGRSNQFINTFMVDPPPGTFYNLNSNFWVLSDHAVPVVTTDHYAVGSTIKLSNLMLDYEFYHKVNTGIMDNNLNNGKSVVNGLDVILQKTTGMYKGWIAYSLNKASQAFQYFNDGKFFPSMQDQRHEVKIINMIALRNWQFSTTWIYGSGRPYPVYTTRYNYDEGGNLVGYDLLRDYKNPSRLPAYHRLDISATYKCKAGKYINIETGLSIFNVYNKTNLKTRKLYAGIFDLFQNTPPDYTDVTLMGITPSLFLNISL